ncbi:MAG: alpha-L-glutamate ligase-like protein [Candidatus Tectomicrobia bacterium]|nr:alpha-L-glutamate ligase-like protein [Candidatus Tectomicrobia bacterium]
MILALARQLRNAGVLGINRRNAEFLSRCNPRALYPRVDDKVLTKQLAGAQGIPIPRLLLVIERTAEIRGFEERLQGTQEFALKPARGCQGSGIVLITKRVQAGFVTTSGEVISPEDLAYHISSILSGIFSLAGLADRAILEELIHPDPVFAALTYRGVPDIRIVVYRGVPVMGMIRLPTRASDGKANLHRGALGAGIDLGRGTTLSAVCRDRVVTHHPDTGAAVRGLLVPHWPTMLHLAARCYELAGLGYLGVDLVLDEQRGPLLLELNARPGLAIQLANESGLLERLQRVDAAPGRLFESAESRAAWAMETFQASQVSVTE